MVKRQVCARWRLFCFLGFSYSTGPATAKVTWVGIASLAKHGLTFSPNESKALSRRKALSLNVCWSRPIAVLSAKERHALRVFSALKSRPFAHSLASSTRALAHGCFVPPCQTRSYLQSATHVFIAGRNVRHTLRISRDNSLTVPDHQQYVGECIFFSAPPVVNACSSFQCVAQPCVQCLSTAFEPCLERTLRQSTHSFRQRLTVATVAFTFQ